MDCYYNSKNKVTTFNAVNGTCNERCEKNKMKIT